MKPLFRRIHVLSFLALMFTSGLVLFSFLPAAKASINITSLNPSTGKVGTLVTLRSNLTTTNGAYQVYFDQQLMANGTASDIVVNANFTVPPSVVGNHTVMVVDVTSGDNATQNFTVQTAYSLDLPVVATPYQEGDSVPISVNITGGDGGITHNASIAIKTPSNSSHTVNLSVPVSATGNGFETVNYPTDFPAGANTSYVGSYSILLNSTLANNTFSVALTNATEYHRGDTVNIKAVYQPNENVTLTVSGTGIQHSVNLTDPAGKISYDWTVPANASINTYTVNVASVFGNTTKNPADRQSFTVPGFAVNVTVKNLAGDLVSSATVKAYENTTVVSEYTTNSSGIAWLKLERGPYNLTGTYVAVVVGETSIQIQNASTPEFVLNLTNLRIKVVSIIEGEERDVPDAGVYLTPYNVSYSTDINGTLIIQSLLPNQSYGLNFSRYSELFNVTQLPTLFANSSLIAWYDVKVTCPSFSLQVTVTKSGGQPFANVLVRIQEALTAPRFEAYTDTEGKITFNPPLGRYTVTVLETNSIELNSTSVDLFETENVTLSCDLYGLTVSVRVVDYFGQPIANVDVKLQRTGQPEKSQKTQGSGTAVFNDVIGGDLSVALYIGDSGQPVEAGTFVVSSPAQLEMRIGKYVTLAGMLVETSLLAIVLIVALIIVFVLAAEVFLLRKRRSKEVESAVESPNKES